MPHEPITTPLEFLERFKSNIYQVDAVTDILRCDDEILDRFISTIQTTKKFVGELDMRTEYYYALAIEEMQKRCKTVQDRLQGNITDPIQ